MRGTYPAALIEAVINTIPSALLLVGHNRMVTEIFISNRRFHYFRERDLGSFLINFLSQVDVNQILHASEQCLVSKKTEIIRQINFQTVHGLLEYAVCYVSPIPEQDKVAVFFRNESESVLLEQEFNSLFEQAEETQKELSVAMSAMDFRLMDLDQSHKRLQALYKVASIVQQNISEQAALEEILSIVTAEFNWIHAAILLLDTQKEAWQVKAQRGYTAYSAIPLDQGIIGSAARNREMVYVPDVSQDARYIQGSADAASELAIPLIVSEQVIGVLDIECSPERTLSPNDIELLKTIAAQAAVAIAHVQHVQQVEKVAITDELTGLYNYHHFCTLLEQEYRRANRYQHALSLLMIDIDFFKQINDSFGHLTGNRVLAQVALLIRQSSRDVDWVCRYGGEEFVVLLPETDLLEAKILAERIREAVDSYSFDAILGTAAKLSVSIGVSGFVAGSTGGEMNLIDCADAALYTAKRAAKNCVRVYGFEGGET